MARPQTGARARGQHRPPPTRGRPLRLTRRGRFVFGLLGAACLTAVAFLPGRAAMSSGWFGASEAAGSDASIRLVAFGDSVPSGYGCDCQSFVPIYADLIHRQSKRVTLWTNFAASGAVSADVVSQLNSPPVVDSVRRAGTVLIMIGANDFAAPFSRLRTDPNAVAQFSAVGAALRTNLATTIRRIHALAGPQVRVVVLGYWNVLEDGRVAQRDYDPAQRAASVLATNTANQALHAAAAEAGAVYVPTLPVFHGVAGNADPTGLLAGDGDHPNVAGHQAIAAALASAVPPSR
jgi:acyl-CoA thioesterase-1